jgi:hypothetical protein
MKNRSKLIFIPFIGALVLALAVGVMAFSPGSAASNLLNIQAQEDEPDQPIPWKGGFGGMRGFGRHGMFGFGTSFDYDAFIADALGVSVAELQAARQAAAESALEQAVAEGFITEEQAELMKARHALMQYIDKHELLAAALGIDVADLEAARQGGKSLADLLDELGLEAADVRDAMQAGYEDAVHQAADDGIITNVQAEEILENGFTARMFGKRGGGFSQRGGFGGRDGLHNQGSFPFQNPKLSGDNDL